MVYRLSAELSSLPYNLITRRESHAHRLSLNIIMQFLTRVFILWILIFIGFVKMKKILYRRDLDDSFADTMFESIILPGMMAVKSQPRTTSDDKVRVRLVCNE